MHIVTVFIKGIEYFFMRFSMGVILAAYYPDSSCIISFDRFQQTQACVPSASQYTKNPVMPDYEPELL